MVTIYDTRQEKKASTKAVSATEKSPMKSTAYRTFDCAFFHDENQNGLAEGESKFCVPFWIGP